MGKEDTQNDVMTLPEVAKYLQLAERTVLRMAQRGEIPAAKVASQWRFIRSVIRDWLAAKMHVMPTSRLKSAVEEGNITLPLGEVVRPGLMNLGVRAGSKDSILRQLVEPLEKTGFAKDPAAPTAKFDRTRAINDNGGWAWDSYATSAPADTGDVCRASDCDWCVSGGS